MGSLRSAIQPLPPNVHNNNLRTLQVRSNSILFSTSILFVAGKQSVDVRKFLNRLLGLKIETQTLLFNYFSSTFKAVISAAKAEGLYTEGISDVRAKNISGRADQSILWVDPVTKLETFKNEFIIDRGISYQEACTLMELERELGCSSGFYKSRRLYFGNYLYVLADRKSVV